MQSQTMERRLHDDYRAIHDETKIDGSQAHQIGADIKYVHEAQCEKHSQWNCRRHNKARTKVSHEDNQYENNDQGTFDKVPLHGRDRTPYQRSAIEVRLNDHIVRQRLLNCRNLFLDAVYHFCTILSFKHHDYPTYGIYLSVIRKRAITQGTAKTDVGYVPNQ